MKYIFSFIFFFSVCFGRELPYDLESTIQGFCLETKRIEVPDYPFAFNPSIVRWNGRLLMSFRIIPNRKQPFNSEIGLVFLNDDFQPISRPQLLALRDEYSLAPCRAEDARLITFGDQLYMVYDDNIEPHLSKGGFRMFIAQIHYDGEHFIADPVELLNQFEGESREVREKAWVPFDYQGRLLLAYSINPHRIFYPRLNGNGICDTIAQSKFCLSWNWGTLRGGTPALLEEEGYLGFFHSSIEMASAYTGGNPITHYFMGAYVFSKEPPFQILKISPEPIIGKHFYKGTYYNPYWKPIRCVFPCGYVRDEKYIWISYGRQDHECWIAKLDKKGLLESLVEAIPK